MANVHLIEEVFGLTLNLPDDFNDPILYIYYTVYDGEDCMKKKVKDKNSIKTCCPYYN